MATTKLYNNIPIYDASVKSFLNSTGLTGTTEVLAVNKLVKDLKKYGLWSKMKAIYPFVSDTYNLLSYTEDFGNAYWSKNGLTVTTDTTIAPDGTLTADTLTAGATGNRAIELSITLNNTSYSIYAKKGNYDQLTILNLGTTCNVRFDLTLGTFTIVSGSGFTPSIVNVGNGWYRCIISNIASTTQIRYYVGANTGDYLYLWGAQAENNSSATTYQPIATTPANRFVSQFKYNLKDPVDMDASFRLVFNGGWTYSKQGATGNGTNAYANTYLTPSTTLGSTFSLSYYSNINVASTSTVSCEIGAFQSGSQMLGLSLRRNLSADLFGTDGYGLSATSTSTTSDFYGISSRISTTSLKLWKNTTLAVTNTTTDTGTKPSIPITLNLNNGLTGYSNRRCAFSHIGDGLTDTEARDLYTIVQRFQVALNRHVV